MSIIENMEYLVRPRTVAMVGASERNIGKATYENMQRLNYGGKVYFVHPKREEILGNKAYKKLADIPDEIDCAVLVLRASLIPDAVTEMKEKGVKAAIIFASGFSEMGEEGRRLQEEVSRRLREAQIAACGANCLGLINLADNIPLYSARLTQSIPKVPSVWLHIVDPHVLVCPVQIVVRDMRILFRAVTRREFACWSIMNL